MLMEKSEMEQSLVNRVKNLPSDELGEVIIHQYNEVSNDWKTYNRDIHGNSIFVGQNWSATQIDEFVFVEIIGLGDKYASIDDNDNFVTGWYVKDSHKAENIQTIQLRSDRGHLVLIILEWYK